ncbi:hypothetical protein EDB85DRAFT_1900578 [Lactarius pseudohatsudake]|nr:hypothetical protein EDB85DRAFT_1900578 [Lactarius pseudohatsudake]
MTTLPPFRLSITSAALAVPATQPTSQVILGTIPNGNSRAQGSFRYDQESSYYDLSWGSLAEFNTWRQEIERADSVEIRLAKKEAKGTGGIKPYEKKHPDQIRKIDSKRLDVLAKWISKLTLGQISFWGITRRIMIIQSIFKI